MPFKDDPLLVEQVNERRWQLAAALKYTGKFEDLTVPEGFETDFASVPRLFWWLVPRFGRYTKAAILHD